MIPPGDCMYAGRKRRKPIQKQQKSDSRGHRCLIETTGNPAGLSAPVAEKRKPTAVSEKSNPSKRHRDRLNAELDRLASLLPFSPDIISKLDKLSVLRLSVSYLRVKSFFQAIQEKPSRKHSSPPSNQDARKDSQPAGTDLTESELLLESLTGFALVVSTDGMVFYASSTIVDYLGFHQTDVMHQNVFDYIHVDDRQEFRRQLHWAMNPAQQVANPDHHLAAGTGEDFVVSSLFGSQEPGSIPAEFSSFLNRCFISRVRCLLDSTSGFLTMQFQGRLKFLHGQKKKTPSGTVLPPQLALFCVAVPLLLPSITEMKMKSMMMRNKHKGGVITALEHNEREDHLKRQASTGGMDDSGDILLFNCPGNSSGQLRHHTPWTPFSKEGVKYKVEGYYSQEEPLNFCKSSVGGHRAHSLENPWTMRASVGAIRVGQNVNLAPNRMGKSSHYGKAGAYRMSPSCHGGRNEAYLPKLYGSMQNPEMESYCMDTVKSENGYVGHGECYDGRMLPEMPIKVEQDSDSENGCDVYGTPHGRAWMCKEHVDKRYGMGYDGLQLKAEAEYYEQYSPCLKNKGNLSPTFNGHYQNMCAGGNRPLKCVLNKDLTQFSPQRLSHSDHLSTNCMNSQMYTNSSMDHKGYMPQDYKLSYEFKGHSLVHSIKREPVDSPPWSGSSHGISQMPVQHNIMPNCVMNTGVVHKTNPYIYMQ
ncbi:aryl hydrocarbon receptor repressor-like isoform X2 [Anguilla anguilla]|uniref:aryl hydrocarbon receptor repressor-like isoform X2 n=1 Tax=Anguilla anguilla TaxID=7936 RepID=UPI0015A9E571|nr:aryl hydrocarbon receptor repressor-like isoform X2 [Anguilla anguilla]